MATRLFKWKIYCTTDNQFEYIWQTSSPITCPVNSGHGVDTNKISKEGDIYCLTIDNTDSPYTYGQFGLLCDTTSGNITVDLPKASRSINGVAFVKKISANNTITINTYENESIDTSTTLALVGLNQVAILYCDGIKWITQTQRFSINDIHNSFYLPKSFTKGDLLVDNGNDLQILSIGTNGQVLIADSTEQTGIKWRNLVAEDITSGTFANARITAGNVTQHEGSINHDNLSGFVTNEHLDWTLDQGKNNIHQNNIISESVIQHQGSINHDSLSGFVANEHINHASVSINTGLGLSGGGTIASTRTINLDIDSLTLDTTPDGDANYVVTYDANALTHKKVLLNNLPGGSGSSNVTAGGNLGANCIVVGDDGVKGVKDAFWTITSNGVLDSNFSYAGYILDVHNTKADGGGNGFRIMAGEALGDIAFHVADQDDTFQILEMEADHGYITCGKTYAQTLSDNGIVYGIDIQHSGVAQDFNTQNGIYRIGGNAVMHGTFFQDASSDTESSTTSTTFIQKLRMTTPSLMSGKYRIGWSFCVKSTGSSGGEYRIQLNDMTTICSANGTDSSTPGFAAEGGFYYASSISGVQNIDVDYRAIDGTFYIKETRLEIWRIS